MCTKASQKKNNNELVTKFRLLIQGNIYIYNIPRFNYRIVYNFIAESNNKNLTVRDELLLCFIRARKYDLHRALRMVIVCVQQLLQRSPFKMLKKPFVIQKFKNYLKMVQNHPGLLTDLKYARVKKHLNLGHLLASPQRDQNGRRVLILNARKFLVNPLQSTSPY